MRRRRLGVGTEAFLLLALSLGAAVVADRTHPRPLPWLREGSTAALEKSLFLASAGARAVKAEEALQIWRAKEALFVDARSPAGFVAGHIPGAVNVTLDPAAGEDILVQADRLPKGQRLIIYCDNAACPKSKELAETLRRLGFTDLLALVDGVEGWQRVSGPWDMGDKGGRP